MATKVSRRKALGLAGAAVVAAGVSVGLFALPESGSDDGPPDIRIGEHSCDECGMVISDERFASGWRTDGGQRRFDDIGCLVVQYRASDRAGVRTWVRDYEDHTWLRAPEAAYVLSEGIHTPMGYGVAAWATQQRADRFVAESDGRVATWDDVISALERGTHHG